jgi:hypothetical protein
MGLLRKIFNAERTDPLSQQEGTRFQDSEEDEDAAQRQATRRELVQLCVRETMRHHGVPSDWVSCRILPVLSRKRKSGMHVQLVVRSGQGSLLRYIPSFQSSLMAEIERFEPRAWDWLLSISWQFEGISSTSGADLPGDRNWSMAGAGSGSGLTAPGALPAGSAAGAAAAPSSAIPEGADDDVAEDLQALFAIRDAALQDGRPQAPAAGKPAPPRSRP